jgi:hypothetical protein
MTEASRQPGCREAFYWQQVSIFKDSDIVLDVLKKVVV